MILDTHQMQPETETSAMKQSKNNDGGESAQQANESSGEIREKTDDEIVILE